MTRPARRLLAERTARAVLLDLGIVAAPICPFAIAKRSGIEVSAMPADSQGCSGMLIRLGDQFGILYATHISSPGFRRFSVAHELGHYFLPDHPDAVLQAGAHRSRASFKSADPFELEADFFAAALLMPSTLFRNAAARQAEGLEAILALKQQFETSLTATAIRYAEHSHAAVAVISSIGHHVDFCFISEPMKRLRPTWLKKGSPLPADSLAGRDPVATPAGQWEKSETDLAAWFDLDRSNMAREEMIELGHPGSRLTILYSYDLSAEAEDLELEDDDALRESWTPRFHR